MPPSFLHRVVDPEKCQWVKRELHRAFGVKEDTSHILVDNPVSLDRANLHRLREEEYTVAYKADGVRYILVLCMFRERPLACMVNRAGDVFSIEVDAQARHFELGSVYDGELCECIAGRNAYDYLVFNALRVQGLHLAGHAYSARLTYIDNSFSPDPVSPSSRESLPMYIHAVSRRLSMVRKERDRAHNIRAMMRNITPRYRTDGLVFTANDRRVRPGRDETTLKYKSRNPIDVLLTVDPDGAISIDVDNDGQMIPLHEVYDAEVTFDANDAFREMVCDWQEYGKLFGREPLSKVAEMQCQFDEEDRLHLVYERLRPDKDGPNNVTTIQRTLQTIRDNIEQRELYDLLAEVCEQRRQANLE